MAGGAIAARFTYRVRSFCSLLEGLPGWIMCICPCGAGYCGSSTRGTAWIALAMLLSAEGCVGGGGATIVGVLEGCGVDRIVIPRTSNRDLVPQDRQYHNPSYMLIC